MHESEFYLSFTKFSSLEIYGLYGTSVSMQQGLSSVDVQFFREGHVVLAGSSLARSTHVIPPSPGVNQVHA